MSSSQNTSGDDGKAAGGRPSLSGGAAERSAAKPAVADSSILQALQNGGTASDAAARGKNTGKLMLFVGCAVVVAVALIAARKAPEPASGPTLAAVEPSPTKAAAPKGGGTAVIASTAAPDKNPAAASPSPDAVARLENLPADKPATATSAAVAAATASAAEPSSQTAQPITPAVIKAQTSPSVAPRVAQPRTVTAKAATTPKAAAAASRTRGAAAPNTAAADAARTGDPDVELMAALMSHVGKTSAESASKPLLRKDQSTIAGLVANCRNKPRGEAEPCRRDICDGYWGKAQACPARFKPVARPADKPGKIGSAGARTPAGVKTISIAPAR